MTPTQPLVDFAQRLVDLPVSLRTAPGFSEVVAALAAGKGAVIDRVWGSSCALATASLVREKLAIEKSSLETTPAPIVVVLPKQDEIDDFLDDFSLFSEVRVDRFPAWESRPGERLVYDDIYRDRLRCIKGLLPDSFQSDTPAASNARQVIATSIPSLLQPLPPRGSVAENTQRIRRGQTLDLDQLARWLTIHGCHHTSAVDLPGEFAVRGGLIDIFAPDWNHPVRIDLFGDQVDQMRSFDVATQRSHELVDQVEITMLPSSGDDNMRAARNRHYLFDYLPCASWFVLSEPATLEREAHRYLQTDESDDLPGIELLFSRLATFGHVWMSALAESTDEAICQLPVDSVQRLSGDIRQVRAELDLAAGDREVLLFCETEAEEKRLREILTESRLVREERIGFPRGRIKTGFSLSEPPVMLLGAMELFHRTDLRRKTRRRLGKRIDSFLDLREGDLVVHLSHGIGRYRGLEVLQRENQVEEHLIVEFAGKTRVYVPITKIDLVQKYVGGGRGRIRLAKLGGKQWVKNKRAAESAATDLAADLLDVQARRAARPGIAFSDDSDWQLEFDASFPYQETDDQLTAIEAIKRDMQAPQPMDRLLCGDVGFGKTELAMRAAFKAVENGYQVAVLVPTTILAEQHFRTFRERIAEFPFAIGKLSRFCTTVETRETLEGLAQGRIDIVIGTHRLASRDVRFDNLGLLVIDEEQRFGVEVKERLKTLRTTVDILTMTATPIPRTLHMSLTGIRDISNLETAPEDRIAVETSVTRWDEQLIRRAVLNELGRGGQIFFVHNRVHDIETLRAKLEQIVPEATIRIGHGQMPEGELSRVMVDFVKGQFDVLLATTIVESGLDIPNANTIFIDDADRYGLSDLHQLRGRVGRYKHRAHCYLLVEKHKHITPEAARRLHAIEEFSEMGAGFAIAMRDLELRGAGNVLGTQQSGHIAAVGYELYCQLLETAVRQMKRLPPKLHVDVNIDLPGEAFLPADYVSDLRLRIDIYRRLTRAGSAEDLDGLRNELEDRFGPLPLPAERLLALTALRMDAAIWQIQSLRFEDRFLVFGYTDEGRVRQLARLSKGKLRVIDSESAYFTVPPSQRTPERFLQIAKSVLQAS